MQECGGGFPPSWWKQLSVPTLLICARSPSSLRQWVKFWFFFWLRNKSWPVGFNYHTRPTLYPENNKSIESSPWSARVACSTIGRIKGSHALSILLVLSNKWTWMYAYMEPPRRVYIYSNSGCINNLLWRNRSASCYFASVSMTQTIPVFISIQWVFDVFYLSAVVQYIDFMPWSAAKTWTTGHYSLSLSLWTYVVVHVILHNRKDY